MAIDRDNHGQPKAFYFDRIAAMSMPELEEETKSKVWLSAFAANNSRSDYHWHVDACYDELKKRTGDDKAYSRIHQAVADSL
jgi:hypothetical protein